MVKMNWISVPDKQEYIVRLKRMVIRDKSEIKESNSQHKAVKISDTSIVIDQRVKDVRSF